MRFSGLSTYLFCVILFLLASSNTNGKTLIKLMIWTSVIVSIIAVLQYYGVNIVPQEEFRIGYHASGTKANPNFLATYTVFILPAAIFFYLEEKNIKWMAAASIIFAALLASFTRGAWLIFLLSLPIFLLKVLVKQGKDELKRFGVLILVLILVASILIFTRNDNVLTSRMLSIPNELSDSVRLVGSGGSFRMHIWTEVMKIIPQYISFGMGPDHLVFAGIEPYPGIIADKAHNAYLEMAVTMGIPALISYLIFLAFFLNPAKAKTNFLYFIMIFAYAGQAFFNIDVVMNMPLFWVILGLSLNPSQRS